MSTSAFKKVEKTEPGQMVWVQFKTEAHQTFHVPGEVKVDLPRTVEVKVFGSEEVITVSKEHVFLKA